jgi:hypothetical protein
MAQHVNTDPPTSSPHSGASQRKKKGKAQRRRQRKIHRSRPPGRLISERSPKWERANDFQTSLDFPFLAKKKFHNFPFLESFLFLASKRQSYKSRRITSIYNLYV